MDDHQKSQGKNSKLERAYLREKEAHKLTAELLENKTRELFVAKEKIESQFKYVENLIETLLNVLFIVDVDYQITSINRAGLKLLQCEEKEVLNTNFLDLFPHTEDFDYKNDISENIMNMFLSQFSDTLNFTPETIIPPDIKDQLTFAVESCFLVKNEKPVPIIFSVSVLVDEKNQFDGFLCVAQDISTQKEAEKNAVQAKNHVEGIINSMANILIITNMEGQIKRVNKSCEKVTGRQSTELLNKNLIDLFVPIEDSGAVKPLDDSMLDLIMSGMFDRSFESRFQGADQHTVPVVVSHSSVMNKETESRRFIFIINDITERKNDEEKIMLAKSELEVTHEELKKSQAMMVQSEKMAGLGQMAAGLAHEINNPIGFITSNVNSIDGYVKAFKKIIEQYSQLEKILDEDEKNSEKIKSVRQEIQSTKEEEDLDFIIEDLDTVINETVEGSNRVKDIVQGLKSFVRLDEGDIKEADVNELLESTLKIANNEIKYKCDVEKYFQDIPTITCYPAQLNQVFMNLIVNGAQSIEDRGVITLETHLEGTTVTIKISDTGCGIESEHLDQLFTPFFTTKDVGEGTGLGLSISHGIIERHKGNIEVESKVGKGTTFTITLPLKCQVDVS